MYIVCIGILTFILELDILHSHMYHCFKKHVSLNNLDSLVQEDYRKEEREWLIIEMLCLYADPLSYAIGVTSTQR